MEKLRRLKYKKIVKVGENVKIKTLAEHEMETGVRRDNITGIIYPRLIIQSVIAKYNGKTCFHTCFDAFDPRWPFLRSWRPETASRSILEVIQLQRI